MPTPHMNGPKAAAESREVAGAALKTSNQSCRSPVQITGRINATAGPSTDTRGSPQNDPGAEC